MIEYKHQNAGLNFNQLVAIEKLQHMHQYSESSTIATIVAPLIFIALYSKTTDTLLLTNWFLVMTLAVIGRFFLIRTIKFQNIRHDFFKLNIAIGMVTLTWGCGWFFFVEPTDMVSYLLYQIISLTVLFVGMVGYCVEWRTFSAFAIPLKIPELVFISLNFNQIVWPIALGSMVAVYLALKMCFLFSKSWEKSFSLRLKNDALFNQLIEEKNASMAANVAKSEFIATASHDLRQPMQSINIFVDMIDPHELQEHHSSIFIRIRKSISVLNRMFNTLLDISKLDSNFSVNLVHFNLMDIINTLEDSFFALCLEKNITLSFRNGNFSVFGDPHLLEQILRNLLANAIQYTDKGHITVTFDRTSECLNFTVEDSGCGIPEEDLPLIFKEFYRSEHSRSHYDGLGLGLSIVNRIVRKIDGQCTVRSEVGQGSSFSIHTQFTIGSDPEASLSRPSGITSMPPHTPLPQAKEQETTVHLGIIENDYALQNAYQQYFRQAGYSVHIIPHEDAAFERYLEFMPKLDFILSDFRLEGHNGIYFIQKLREEFNWEIPACIITADTSPQHLELFSQHNIDVMYKPIDIKSVAAFMAQKIQSVTQY